MKLSIVIPVTMKNTIQKYSRSCRKVPIQDKEIIVVDDCSKDGTRMFVKRFKTSSRSF